MAALLYFQTARGGVPLFLWLALLIVLYLAVVELRPLEMPIRIKVWWFSLVLLTHVFGYVVLRAYVFDRAESARMSEPGAACPAGCRGRSSRGCCSAADPAMAFFRRTLGSTGNGITQSMRSRSPGSRSTTGPDGTSVGTSIAGLRHRGTGRSRSGAGTHRRAVRT